MIENLLVTTSSFSTTLSSYGNLVSNALSLTPPLKQNIRPQLMVLLRFFGSVICFQIYASLLVLLPLFGARTWVLLICLLIRCFMRIPNMWRLIITLFVIELPKKRYRFASYPPKTNQPMFLLSRSLTLHFPIYDPSFKWTTHLQLEGECYGMCFSLGKIVFSLYRELYYALHYTVTSVFCPTHINMGDGYCIM